MNLQTFEESLQSLILEYEKSQKGEALSAIEKLFEEYLGKHEKDIANWLKFAIFLYEDLHDDVKALELLLDLLSYNPTDIYALLLLAYISFTFLHMNENFILEKLKNFKSDDLQLMSLVAYTSALCYEARNDNLYKYYLEKSIKYFDGYVWNNYKLGCLYLNEGKIEEANKLISRALKNVQYIYPYPSTKEYKITPIDEFINERLKGVYITKPNLEFIQDTLAQIKSN